MAVYFWPGISPQQYQAFRQVLGSQIPDTFGEWSYSCAKERAQLAGEGGHSLVEVPVDFDEFTRHCATMNAPRNRGTLEGLASQKGLRKQH